MVTDFGLYWESRWTDELLSRNAAGRVEVPAVRLPCAGLPSLPAALFARWGCGHPADWLDTHLLPCATPGCPHDSALGASYLRAVVQERVVPLLRRRESDGWHWHPASGLDGM